MRAGGHTHIISNRVKRRLYPTAPADAVGSNARILRETLCRGGIRPHRQHDADDENPEGGADDPGEADRRHRDHRETESRPSRASRQCAVADDRQSRLPGRGSSRPSLSGCSRCSRARSSPARRPDRCRPRFRPSATLRVASNAAPTATIVAPASTTEESMCPSPSAARSTFLQVAPEQHEQSGRHHGQGYADPDLALVVAVEVDDLLGGVVLRWWLSHDHEAEDQKNHETDARQGAEPVRAHCVSLSFPYRAASHTSRGAPWTPRRTISALTDGSSATRRVADQLLAA